MRICCGNNRTEEIFYHLDKFYSLLLFDRLIHYMLGLSDIYRLIDLDRSITSPYARRLFELYSTCGTFIRKQERS